MFWQENLFLATTTHMRKRNQRGELEDIEITEVGWVTVSKYIWRILWWIAIILPYNKKYTLYSFQVLAPSNWFKFLSIRAVCVVSQMPVSYCILTWSCENTWARTALSHESPLDAARGVLMCRRLAACVLAPPFYHKWSPIMDAGSEGWVQNSRKNLHMVIKV